MSLWHQVALNIAAQTGKSFTIVERQAIGGGSINHAYRISDGVTAFFVKTNRSHLAYMFEAEALGLQAIVDTGTIKAPQPITHGVHGSDCYAVMSWLDLGGQPDSQLFAQKLAAMHQHEAERFGFAIDNSIGSTPQVNTWTDDWVEFWREHRLGYQLELARENGFGHRLYDLGQDLRQRCNAFFTDYQPRPSLLHGDLWSGNWAGDRQGEPVIFDPAVYYGDREADLAMMELFGSPGRAFFAAYDEAYPIDAGYSQRKTLYNLYHILNHANLFGSSYAMQAERMLAALLAEVR